MKTIRDFINEKNCDNYLIYQEKESLIPIISFYQGLYTVNNSEEIYLQSTENICSYYIENDKIFTEQKNLILIVKKQSEEK